MAICADVADALEKVRARVKRRPVLALILGSGLGALADSVEDPVVIRTSTLPGYPASTVAGHAGELIIGSLEGKPVVFVRGRVHAYEGHSIRDVAFPVRLVHALGATHLLVTNAAGGINRHFSPGTLMFISDVINLGGANPLVGPNADGGPRFPDMSAPLTPDWLDRAEQQALSLGIHTRRGVYLWTLGPSYETRAEIRFFRTIGADAVGMSTVPEVIQARYLDMQVLGISTITNLAAGLHPVELKHEDVLEVGDRVRAQLELLIRSIVRNGMAE